ncbi:FtsB family cell division protein [Nisaea nitritireducens]|uniref:FtsB family cell division protein n=1 Tax=Nisaea nitritireducens TaxID=568392 RepID=UPI00186708B2|nr:septum formation initiator family protein [Nisaea nitritireducens]
MTLAFEIKRRARHVVGPVIGCLLLGYFVFHSVEGDRGIHAWRALDSKIEVAEAKLAVLKGKREALEKKVAMLHPDSIDQDLLTEQARRVLNYLDQDDFVISGMSATGAPKSIGAMQQTIDAAQQFPKVRAISTASGAN